MRKISKNSISLAGEFAVLSQLALRGYDANLTLGNTKGVDILVSDPKTHRMYQLEVKTNFQNSRNKPHVSKIHGKSVSGWIMNKKHETISSPTLFYCFVNIEKDTSKFNFFIVPSNRVAKYVKEQHQLYLNVKRNAGIKVKNSDLRVFRIGMKGEKHSIKTPTTDKYQNNWSFKK